MADIFDEVLAERKSVPKKDIFDEVLSERQTKGGVKQNENAESKSDQGTRPQGDAQRTLDGKVNATNAPRSEGGGELRPLDEGQSQRIYEARVSTDSVKGGENNAKQENAQAEAGYGPQVRKEDGQGVRSQEDARNKEEVKTAGSVQPAPKSFVEKVKEDPKSAIVAGIATAAEAGIPMLAGSVAARVLTPLATAAAIETGPAAPFIGAGAGLTGFAATADVTKRIVQETERALGISSAIKEAQAKQQEITKGVEVATMAPFLIQSGAGLLRAAATGTTEAAIKGGSLAVGAAKEVGKRVAAGGAAGTIYEGAIRYPVEKGIQRVAGGEQPQKPSMESVAQSALTMAALSGAGEEIIRKAGLPETAEVAGSMAPDDAIAKRFEEAPAKPITIEPVKEATVEEKKSETPVDKGGIYEIGEKTTTDKTLEKYGVEDNDLVKLIGYHNNRILSRERELKLIKEYGGSNDQIAEAEQKLRDAKNEKIDALGDDGDVAVRGSIANRLEAGTHEWVNGKGLVKKEVKTTEAPVAEPSAEAQPTKPSETEIKETSGLPTLQGKPSVGEAEVKAEGGVAQGKREGEEGQVDPAAESEKEEVPSVQVIPVSEKKLGQVDLTNTEDFFSPIKKVPFSDQSIKQRQFFVDRKIVEKYKKDILDGKPISPITINKNGDVYDGYHRATALEELGFKEYPAVFITDEYASGEQFADYPDWSNAPRQQKVNLEQVNKAEELAGSAYDADNAFKKSLNEEGLSSKGDTSNDFFNRYRNAISLYKEGKVIFTDNKSLISELKNRGWSEKRQQTKPAEPSKPEATIPEGARVAAAAYLAPDGKTYEGSSHLDAMQKAKEGGAITQAEIEAKQSPESRNTDEFGFKVTLPDGSTQVTTREAAGKIAKQSGQSIVDEFVHGDKLHSNETEKDEYDENGKRRVPPYLLNQNPTEYARQGLQLGLEEEVKDPIYKKEIADAIADPSKKLSNEGRLQFDKILRRLNITRDDMQGMGIVPPGTKETIFLIDQTKDSFSKLSDIIMDKKLPNAYKAGVLPEMYQHAGAHIAVPSIADNFYSKIFPETYKSDPEHINKVGDFLNKDQIVGGYENFKKSLDIINDRLESETDSKIKNKLSREKKETEQAIADIEEVHDIPALKTELTETIKDDAVARDVKRVIDILNPWMDQMYNEGKNVDPNTPREGRGWISGARINLLTKADAEKLAAYGDPEKPAPQPSINSTSNVKIRRDRFARKALFTGDYTSNMYDIITNSVGARWNNVTKLRIFNALVDKGLAVLDEPGKPRPEEIGGEGVAKIETPWPETNPETGITTMKNKVLWVKKSLYPELDRALDSSLKPSKIGILTPLTKIQTYGLGDFTAHGTNLLAKTLVAAAKKPPRGDTSLSKIPLIGRATEAFKDLMDLSYQYHKNTPEIREKIKELAELGVVRAEYGSEKPTVFGIKLTTTHKILHDIDTVARLYAAKAYDELADQGYTNYNKSDKIRFIAALGEYNRRLMGQKSAFLRDTGISPFIVAGRAMNAAAIETIAPLSTPYKASNFKTRIKANAGIVGAAAAATIFPAIVNMFTTGSLTGRYGTPLGVIDFGPSFDTEDGKRRSIDLYKPLFIRRGLRATGLNAVINGLMTGESPEDIQNHAANEMATTWSHPFVGPGIGFLTMVATGKRIDLRSGYATRIEPRKMKGALMQKIENLRIGLKELSPLGYELLKRPVIQPVMEKGLGVERPGEEIVQDIKAKEKGGGAGSQALATGKDIAVSALKQLGSGILGYKESTSPAERLASELGEGVQFTAKEDARFAYRREYINMVKRGEKNQADILLSQAVNDGIMEKADFKSLKRSLKNPDKIVAKVGMLKTPDAAIRVFRVASPQEQDLIYNEVAKKIQGSSTLNQQEKQKQINDLVSFSKKGTILRHYLDTQKATAQ
jgi:hypothetical protein